MTTKIDSLGAMAAHEAMKAAAEYVRRFNLAPDLDQLTEALRRHAKAAIVQGMADAKAALDCNMPQGIAGTTFVLSMRLAGIAAAREVTGHTA